ncbi:fumarate hydratase [Pedobacter sp. MR2016-24]|uniref:fumarate hydratase n=1 Tax=Pedobacter sp. MR2016-24 TaxID=2994466 RepID=UPI00224680B0|nr:fumarate hydratase [Pedobacter sp. MR2016-24]MCX2482135.1 fumarate hydratase [Pedobacter sp. MR2016-24]
MNKYHYLIILCSLMAFLGCERRPNVQGNGETFLQGVWNQDSIANSSTLMNYTQHHLKFTCDSFYVDMTTHSKVNYYEDPCYNNGVWKEYAKGVYEVRKDSLFLLGTYTKSNYKQKVSGCYTIGIYRKSFLIKSSGSQHLSLQSLSDQRDVNLVLKQKITCVPQQL